MRIAASPVPAMLKAVQASRLVRYVRAGAMLALLLPVSAFSQTAFTWEQLKAKFESTNPTLKANQANIEESRAEEITAFLRPNPDLLLSTDGTQITPYQGVFRPLAGTFYSPNVSYLHERRHKRELRLETAQENTAVTESTSADQERSLLFTLRNSFVQVLQAKALIENAKQNLAYWDRELGVNRKRMEAGDMAAIDYDRLVLQRAQFESDFETATVNLRTAKIGLLQLLNDRTPLDQFDVNGPFDFNAQLRPLQEFRDAALTQRPDLKAAVQSVALAKSTYQLQVANGSTDPTFAAWYTHNGSFNNPAAYNTLGLSVAIPLRIFDRNQGEKARTLIDIRRNQRLQEAAEALVLNDVDSAYATLVGQINLLKPYQEQYLPVATKVRDRVTFAYQHGGLSLLDYQDAEKSYRDTRLAYLTLVGSYLTAVAQMNLAVGREIM